MTEQDYSLQVSGERFEESPRYAAAIQWVYDTTTSAVDDTAAVLVAMDVMTDGSAQFNVSVAPSDLGKLIGKGGSGARAFRRMLHGRGGKDGIRYTIDFKARTEPITPREDWRVKLAREAAAL